MPYVIRSMTTTDYDYRSPLQAPRPYHIYLQPEHKRAGAWWAPIWHAQVFDTPQAAQAELDRAFGDKLAFGKRRMQDDIQIAPLNDSTFPEFWTIQAMNRDVKKYDVKAMANADGKVRAKSRVLRGR